MAPSTEPADIWIPKGVVLDYAEFLSWLVAHPKEIRRITREQYEDENDPRELLDIAEETKKAFQEQYDYLMEMANLVFVSPESYATIYVQQPTENVDLSYSVNVETYTGPPHYQIFGPLHFWALTVPMTARASGGWRPYYRPYHKPWDPRYGLPTAMWRAKSGEFNVFLGNPWNLMRKNDSPLGTMRAFVRVWIALAEFLKHHDESKSMFKRDALVGLRVSDSPKASSGVVGHMQISWMGGVVQYWWSDPKEMDPLFDPLFSARNGISFYKEDIYKDVPF